jgi:hypothetical protein
VKLVGDRAEGLYNTYLAEGELPPPQWPDKTYWELVVWPFPIARSLKTPTMMSSVKLAPDNPANE